MWNGGMQSYFRTTGTVAEGTFFTPLGSSIPYYTLWRSEQREFDIQYNNEHEW